LFGIVGISKCWPFSCLDDKEKISMNRETMLLLSDYTKWSHITLKIVVDQIFASYNEKEVESASNRQDLVSLIKGLKDHLQVNPKHKMLQGKDKLETLQSVLDKIINDHLAKAEQVK
jgi:SET domain-containing protein